MVREVCVGIDLGTTNTVVAAYENDQVTILHDQGERLIPSAVSYIKNERLVGFPAYTKKKEGRNPRNTVFGVKRLLGREFQEKEVQNDVKHWQFVVKEDTEKKRCVIVLEDDKTIRPEEISAAVLSKVKSIVKEYFNLTENDIVSAIITVPAYFNDDQKQSTMTAGTIAELKVIRLLHEPTAAALAFGFQKKIEKKTNVLVYDLGGGTFDVSILTIENGVYDIIATSGDTHLGGDDFDNNLANYIIEEYKKANPENKDFEKNVRVMSEIRIKANEAKVALSQADTYELYIDKLDFEMDLHRSTFVNINKSLFEKTITLTSDLVEKHNMKGKIDEILLVGGSTKIPKIKELLQDHFKKSLRTDINPDEAVAYGAAIQAANLTVVDKKGTKIENITLLDVTPHNLGVMVGSDTMSVIIPEQSKIPASYFSEYIPHSPLSSSVDVMIYQGNSVLVKDNLLIGSLNISGFLPKALTGEFEVLKVDFKMNQNGMLEVNVTCLKNPNSSKSTTFTLARNGGFSIDELDKAKVANKHFEKQVSKSPKDNNNANWDILKSDDILNQKN
jgi:molecular chaperone DnaK (HSP70)